MRWLIPKRHTLTSAEECNKLLKDGYTLINNMGLEVSLNEDGTQNKTNKNRKRNYKFSNPHLWQCLHPEITIHSRTITVDTKTVGFWLSNCILQLGRKWL